MLGYLTMDIVCSSSYTLRKLFASQNRYCPRTDIQAYFCAKGRLLLIYILHFPTISTYTIGRGFMYPTKFDRGRLHFKVQQLSLLYTILTEKVPLSCTGTFIIEKVPLSYASIYQPVLWINWQNRNLFVIFMLISA